MSNVNITYGLLPVGWISKPIDVIEDEIDADLQGILGASSGTEPDGTIPPASIAGQLKALLVDGFSAGWDLDSAIVASFDPNQANDAAQDAVCAISGTTREGQSFSTVTAQCTGDAGTVLSAVPVATVAISNSRFDGSAATLNAVAAWVATTGYVIGNRVTNANNVYHCITSGTSAGSGGPATTAVDITDGSAHWRYLGAGKAVADVVFTAESAGPVGALSGTLNAIATPVNGWRGVTNLLDAKTGAFIESNNALRARREAELAPGGESTPEAIRSRVLSVGATTNNPVTSCRVFYNDTDYVDANGLLPHSVEVVVLGGADDTTPPGISSDPAASVAAAVWSSVAAGTRTLGNTAITIIDSQGNAQVVNFQRATPTPIWVDVAVSYDPAIWTQSNAATLVVQYVLSALLTYTQGWFPGVSVRSQPLGAAVNADPALVDGTGLAVVPAPAGSLEIPGIVEVNHVFISTAPSPTLSTTIPITPFAVATFDSSRVNVVAVPEVP